MAIFLLSYDLHHEDGWEHYQAFRGELRRLRAHRLLERACLLNLDTDNPRKVVETLHKTLEENDRLVASRLDSGSYWYLHALPGTNDWLQANPTQPHPAVDARTQERPDAMAEDRAEG